MVRVLHLIFLFFAIASNAQNSNMAQKVLILINEARLNPQIFLNKYSSEIQKHNPKFLSKLKSAKSIDNVIWDEGLVTMDKNVVEKKALNPIYAGQNKMCGESSGSGSDLSINPLEYVCRFYTNVLDKNYKYFGIYFNDANTSYSFHWGISCEREKLKFVFNEIIDSSKVDFDKLNTAKNTAYLSALEKKMIEEINFVRAYPKVYAKIVARHLFNESNAWSGLNQDTYDAGLELIEELNSMKPLSILKPSQCIYNAAKLHGQDCAKRGFFDHTGSDKSNPWDRILKQCPSFKMGNENYTAWSESNARFSVITLLLDDGISERGHRYNLFDKRWTHCACYTYQGHNYKFNWIQNFGY